MNELILEGNKWHYRCLKFITASKLMRISGPNVKVPTYFGLYRSIASNVIYYYGYRWPMWFQTSWPQMALGMIRVQNWFQERWANFSNMHYILPTLQYVVREMRPGRKDCQNFRQNFSFSFSLQNYKKRRQCGAFCERYTADVGNKDTLGRCIENVALWIRLTYTQSTFPSI